MMSNKALDYLNKVDFEGAFDLSKIPAGERDLWEQRAKLMLHYRDLVFQRIADNKPVADVLKELKAISTTDPKYYKVYTKWAKENKLVPHTEAHHKFGVNKNSLTALGIKPHQLRDQHLYLQDFDIHLGNNPFNREYLSRLAHTGSRLITPGKPGSMEASAHPGGTKIIDAELTSTKPKARAEEIAKLNEGAIQAAQTAVLSDQQFRQNVNDIVSETSDVRPYVLDKTGILVPNNGSIKFEFSSREKGIIKQFSRNPYFYELNAGLGTDAYRQLKGLPKSIKPGIKAGAVGGVASVAVSSLITGDPKQAVIDTLASPIDGGGFDNVSRVQGTNLYVNQNNNEIMPSTKLQASKGRLGLAYKNGKPIAVPYGSVAGQASAVDIVKTVASGFVKSIPAAIQQGRQEWELNGHNSEAARTRAAKVDLKLGSIVLKIPKDFGVTEFLRLNR